MARDAPEKPGHSPMNALPLDAPSPARPDKRLLRFGAAFIVLALAFGCASQPDRISSVERAPTRALRLGQAPNGLADGPPDGLPASWERYVGFDTIAVREAMEWSDDQLDSVTSNTLTGTTASQVVLFQLTLTEDGSSNRWFVLIEEPKGMAYSMGRITDPEGSEAGEDSAIYMTSTIVRTTVAAAGSRPEPSVVARVPTLPTKAGFPLLANPSILAARERGSQAAERALYVAERRTLASLGTLLETAQAHPQLGPLLMSVVEKPSLLGILRHGGIVLEILAPHGDVVPATVDWPGVGPLRAAAIPGVILASGVRALEVEWLAVDPEEPLSFVSGIVHVSASHPKHPDRTVELHLIGARSITDK